MVDYNIQPVQIPNFAAGIGNAMDDRYKFQLEQARANHLARQDEVALQNEMLRLKAGQAAIANAAASKAAIKNALGESVIPLPGEAPGPQLPSLQNAQSRLALSGRFPEANILSNTQEQFAKQDTQRNLANKAAGEVNELTLKNEATMSAQAKDAIDMATSPDQLREMVVRLHAPDSKLAAFFDRNGITADRAIAEYDRMVASGVPFEQIRQQMSMGAAKTAIHLADLAQKEAQTYQANAAATKSMGELAIAQSRAPVDIAEIQARTGQANATAAKSAGELDLAQQQRAWERANPDYTLQETAQGMVAVNKRDPTDAKLIKINGETVMPFKNGQTINVGDQTPQFNKSLGEAQAKKVVESQTAAKGAANQLDTIAEGEKLLNSGMYTGTGATFQVGVGQALQKMGFTAKDDAAANAQAYGAIMGKQVGEMVKQFGSGTSISDGDRIYAERMAAGDINLDEQAMRKILRINKEAALKLIRSHNKTVSGVKSDLPLTVGIPASAAPPAEAVKLLKSKDNAETRKQFDQWYGEGAAEDVLGQ